MKPVIYKWQGEPVEIEFGYCFVKTNHDKPLWWYNYECSLERNDCAIIPAVFVTVIGTEPDYGTFCLANHYGIAINKLSKGGWPNQTHFSLQKDLFKKDKSMPYKLNVFEEEYAKHESLRSKWQKENFPKEFEQIESLRRMAHKNMIGKP